VPRLIEAAYHGRSLGVLNNIITGQSTRSLDQYLTHWGQIANPVTLGLALTGAGRYPVLLVRHRLLAAASALV
jgi:hypothetical protein